MYHGPSLKDFNQAMDEEEPPPDVVSTAFDASRVVAWRWRVVDTVTPSTPPRAIFA